MRAGPRPTSESRTTTPLPGLDGHDVWDGHDHRPGGLAGADAVQPSPRGRPRARCRRPAARRRAGRAAGRACSRATSSPATLTGNAGQPGPDQERRARGRRSGAPRPRRARRGAPEAATSPSSSAAPGWIGISKSASRSTMPEISISRDLVLRRVRARAWPHVGAANAIEAPMIAYWSASDQVPAEDGATSRARPRSHSGSVSTSSPSMSNSTADSVTSVSSVPGWSAGVEVAWPQDGGR